MPSAPAALREFEKALVAKIDPVAVPSVAYGVVQGGETILLGAAGVADKAHTRAATTQTSYALASVTKPMTATAVMMLAERGLVDLDAPIERYLGDARLTGKAGDPQAATVRRVADHTAGLSLFYTFFYEDESVARPPFAQTVGRYGMLVTAPGERHQYSNLGYGLLDELVAHVSGVPYARFMANEIFAPLGMAHSAIDAPTLGDVAIAYGPDGVAYPRYDFDHPGGSSAYASVEDLLAFGNFHLGHGPALLSDESRRAMQVPTSVDAHRQYGFGWGVNPGRHGRTLVAHTGGMGGVNTVLRLVPELDVAIAILVNGQSDLPFRGADDALAALDPIFREGLERERAAPKPVGKPTPVPKRLWGDWRGAIETYEGDRTLSLTIRSGTEATARLDGSEAPVDEMQIAEGRLLGVFDGDLRTPDAARRPHRIHLDLAPRDATLSGVAVTIAKSAGGEARERRMGNALPHWTSLRRA